MICADLLSGVLVFSLPSRWVVLESDPSCKRQLGSWRVMRIHSIMHMFSDVTPLHFSTIRSSLVTGLLHLNTHPTHPRWLKRAEKGTPCHTHVHDNESFPTRLHHFGKQVLPVLFFGYLLTRKKARALKQTVVSVDREHRDGCGS